MKTLAQALEVYAKFAGKGFENGRIATIVSFKVSARKTEFGMNYCTAEDIEAGSYIGADGRTTMNVIQVL